MALVTSLWSDRCTAQVQIQRHILRTPELQNWNRETCNRAFCRVNARSQWGILNSLLVEACLRLSSSLCCLSAILLSRRSSMRFGSIKDGEVVIKGFCRELPRGRAPASTRSDTLLK